MGTTIDAVAVAAGRGLSVLRRPSARKLADTAAHKALERASLDRRDVELLVNAGLYHDRSLGEPALAALIQEDIGANPEDPHSGHHGTFSFDVASGACGMLTGLQLVDGFLRSGTIEHGLVVASDSLPQRRGAREFPYAPVGAAIACGWRSGPEGLTGFGFGYADQPDGAGDSRVTVGFEHGRNQLRFRQSPDFLPLAAETAAEVASDLLADHSLDSGEVDLVVANPLDPEFLDALAKGFGVDPGLVVSAPRWVRAHTAGLAVALHEAEAQGRLAPAATVLLVSGGAGLTAAAALLRR